MKKKRKMILNAFNLWFRTVSYANDSKARKFYTIIGSARKLCGKMVEGFVRRNSVNLVIKIFCAFTWAWMLYTDYEISSQLWRCVWRKFKESENYLAQCWIRISKVELASHYFRLNRRLFHLQQLIFVFVKICIRKVIFELWCIRF